MRPLIAGNIALWAFMGGEPADVSLVNAVRIGHRHAVESIRTIRAEFSIEDVDSDRKGERWEMNCLEDDTGRQRYTERRILPPSETDATGARIEFTTECVNLDKESRRLTRWRDAVGRDRTGGSISPWQPDLGIADLWLHALFIYSQRPYRRVSELLDGKLGPFDIAESASEPGLVEVSFQTVVGTSYSFVISSRQNLLVQRIEESNPPGLGMFKVTVEVLEFMEVNPGIYFPRTVRKTIEEKKGGERTSLMVHIRNVIINEPVADAEFELDFPNGCQVVNEFEGTIELIGARTAPGDSSASSSDDKTRDGGATAGAALVLITIVLVSSLSWVRRRCCRPAPVFGANERVLPMRCGMWLVIGVCLIGWGCGHAEGGRGLSVEPSEISVDAPRKDLPINASFVIRNEGSAPLRIFDIHGSCHCEVLTVGGEKVTAKQIEAGGSALVKARFNARNSWGNTRYFVSFKSSDPACPEKTVIIRGRIGPIFRAVPDKVSFGRVPLGQSETRRLRIRVPPGEGLNGAPTIAVSTDDFVVSSARRMASGLLLRSGFPEGVDVLEVDVLARSNRIGDLDGTLRISFEGEVPEVLEVPVMASIVPEYIIKPSAIRLPLLSERGPLRSTDIRWKHRAAEPFTLRLREEPPGVRIEIMDLAPAEKEIKVTLKAEIAGTSSLSLPFEARTKDKAFRFEVPVMVHGPSDSP